MTDTTGVTRWQYNPRGQMVQETRTINNGYGTFATAWTYNSAGLPATIQYPANNQGALGEIVTTQYNSQMQPTSVLGDTFPHAYSYNSFYDAAGRLLKRTMGNSANILLQNAYYPYPQQGGRLQRLTAGTLSSPTSLMDFTYTYDSVGNVKTILDAQNSAQVQSFDYDELDRLKAGGTTLTGDGQFARETYTYTLATGNLLVKAGLTYTYGDPTHAHAVTALSNGNQYAYDANGNMTSRHVLENGVWKDYTLMYDGDNRLISVTGAASANFGYDGDGRRIWATTGLTTTVFIGNYYEWNVALSEGTSYYYAGSTRLAMRKGSGEAAYFITDHLGSTNKLVTPAGAPLLDERQLYKPWGENRPSTLLTLTRYTYTGQYAQTEVGLMYYQARWYDPALGRFAQADSIIPETSQGVQAWDRYAGMNNNPVKYNDPSGHCILGCIGDAMLIGGAIGAAAGATLYAANIYRSGQSFNWGEMGLAAVAGAAAGAAIAAAPVALAAGSISLGGATTIVSAATGMATSGGGYMVANALTRNQFSSTDFAIAAATGAVTGALGPNVAVTRTSASVLNGVSGAVQYELTTYANTGNFAFDMGLAKSGAAGFAGGWIGGAYTKPTNLLNFAPRKDGVPRSITGWCMGCGYHSPDMWRDAARTLDDITFKTSLPRGLAGGFISNLIPQY